MLDVGKDEFGGLQPEVAKGFITHVTVQGRKSVPLEDALDLIRDMLNFCLVLNRPRSVEIRGHEDGVLDGRAPVAILRPRESGDRGTHRIVPRSFDASGLVQANIEVPDFRREDAEVGLENETTLRGPLRSSKADDLAVPIDPLDEASLLSREAAFLEPRFQPTGEEPFEGFHGVHDYSRYGRNRITNVGIPYSMLIHMSFIRWSTRYADPPVLNSA